MRKMILICFLVICVGVLLGQEKKEKIHEPVLLKKPWKAATLSLFIPAGGQIYNESYWRAATVLGIETALLLRANYWDSKVNDYREKKKLVESGEIENPQYNYSSLLDTAKENRTSFYWWIGVAVGGSILEAYVDAHLSNYKQEERNLHLFFEKKKVGVRYHF